MLGCRCRGNDLLTLYSVDASVEGKLTGYSQGRPVYFGFNGSSHEHKHSSIQPRASEFSYSSNSLLVRIRFSLEAVSPPGNGEREIKDRTNGLD